MRRQKACEFCEDEHWTTLEAGRNASTSVEVYPGVSHIAIVAQGFSDDNEMTGENTMIIELNYCPVCGRKLTSITWTISGEKL